MKIGIITIVDNNNYGNRLQNYALQETLNKLGHEVVTIKNISTLNSKEKYFLRIMKYVKIKTFDYFFKVNKVRYNSFKKFDQKIKFSEKLYTVYNFPKSDDFDYFIVGSDQVWNPKSARLRNIDLLTFAKDRQKISYAASFGISEVDEVSKSKIKRDISTFKAVSVREEAGKRIINDANDRIEVSVLIDPTLLLDKSEWEAIATKPVMLKSKKYILNYFLGSLSENVKQEIDRVARENNCDVINILDKESSLYGCGPAEFLYLEQNAFLICTDSFHSSVFALIFNRPFIIFDRNMNKKNNNMSSRLDNLLEKFQLKNRKYNGKKICSENLLNDYTKAYEILKDERKKSDIFLRKNLDYKEEENEK